MIELSELQDAAQKAFPADKLAPPRDAAWQLVAEMGWLMIDLPEDLGGLGLGREAAAAIHFEMGRVLSTAPLIPAMLGIEAMVRSTELEGREGWIERAVSGEYIPLHLLPAAVSARSDGALDGRVAGFLEADMAGHVLAALSQGYYLIPTDGPGVSLEERPLWDQSRRIFDLVLDGYRPDPALAVATGEAALRMHDELSPGAQIGLAADSLGGACAALEMTIEYLKMRRQFDRPLAMFQALKHRCADLKIAIEGGEALMWARARDPQATSVALGAMKALAADTYRLVVEEVVQLHGGIGLTEEHQCHLFLKRALLNLQLCGSVDHWREQAGRAALG